MLLPLGESPSAYLRGDETAFRNTPSPDSRCCLSLNLITGPQTKHQPKREYACSNTTNSLFVSNKPSHSCA